MRKAVLAGVAVVSLTGAAIAAPAGAPQDAATQGGAWGPNGWQAGAAAQAPQPAGPSAMPAPQPGSPQMAAPPMGPEPMGPPPMMMHGAYRPVHPGQKLKGDWRDPALTVGDWRQWGLPAPGYGTHWIRYYDDAVLVDGDDRVVAVPRGPIGWDDPRRGWHGHHDGMGGPGWHHPPVSGVTSYRAGPHTTVTTETIAPPPIVYGGHAPVYGGGYEADYGAGYGYGAGYDDGYGYGPGYGGGYGYAGGGSIVTVTPGVTTTTTTTTTERVWHKVRVRGCGCARPIRSGKLVRR